MHFLDAETEFHANSEGLFTHTRQEIDRGYIDGLRASYDASATSPMGDYHRVASVPVAVIEKWMREGFDMLRDKNITPAQIVARLRRDGLDYFVTSKRAV